MLTFRLPFTVASLSAGRATAMQGTNWQSGSRRCVSLCLCHSARTGHIRDDQRAGRTRTHLARSSLLLLLAASFSLYPTRLARCFSRAAPARHGTARHGTARPSRFVANAACQSHRSRGRPSVKPLCCCCCCCSAAGTLDRSREIFILVLESTLVCRRQSYLLAQIHPMVFRA